MTSDHYLAASPFVDLAAGCRSTARRRASDPLAGLCSAGVPVAVRRVRRRQTSNSTSGCPSDDFRGPGDFADLTAQPPATFEAANLDLLAGKARRIRHAGRRCRRSSSTCGRQYRVLPGRPADPRRRRRDPPRAHDLRLVLDSRLQRRGDRLRAGWRRRPGGLPARPTPSRRISDRRQLDRAGRAYGFFGGEHEQASREWDANGEALWAFGKFDRIQGPGVAFGPKVYWPYVLQGARWIRDNRSPDGIMLSGWSAEHIGDSNQPHYWDDLWGLAGLYEAARLAERIGAAEVAELWAAFDSLKAATAASIRWVLTAQRDEGQWETYVPSGPGADRGLYSTMIGSVAYFHPTRLYYGSKLGDDLDLAFRLTLDTIWSHFVEGGFRHDRSWQAYGPYLTLQLAHAFLLLGDLDRMDALLGWTIGNAAFARVSRYDGAAEEWQVTTGTWNEQHAYPSPTTSPRCRSTSGTWATCRTAGPPPNSCCSCARSCSSRPARTITGSCSSPPVCCRAGSAVAAARSVTVTDAATTYGTAFGYTLVHDEPNRRLLIDITQPVPAVNYVYTCRARAP